MTKDHDTFGSLFSRSLLAQSTSSETGFKKNDTRSSLTRRAYKLTKKISACFA